VCSPVTTQNPGEKKASLASGGILQLSRSAVNVKLLIDKMHLFYSFNCRKNYWNMRMGSLSFMIVSAISFMLLRLFWLCRRNMR